MAKKRNSVDEESKLAQEKAVSRRDFFAAVAGSLDNDELRERFMREAGFVEV